MSGPAKARLARPIDCARLLLIDPAGGRVRLILEADSPARPPLARLEPGDGAFSGPAPPPAISRRALGCAEARAAAFADAAIRAGFESWGVLIAHPAPGAPAAGRSAFWRRIAGHGLAPDRAALTYLGRTLSPPNAPERRHVRIFAAPATAASRSLIGRPGAARSAWLDGEAAKAALADSALAPFLDLAFEPRPAPIRVSYRAGRIVTAALA